MSGRRPGSHLVGHLQPKFVEGDVRIGVVEVLIGRNLAALHRQCGLDEADDARGRLEVAQVGFGGPDEQRVVLRPTAPVHGAQRARLDGITEERPGSVCLHVVDLRGFHAGVGAGGPQDGGLGGRVGCHQAVGPAVLVDRRPAHHRKYPVSVAQRVGEPFEHCDPAALAADESVGRRVECVAGAGARHGLGLIEAAGHHR